jgi:hypothetical protein
VNKGHPPTRRATPFLHHLRAGFKLKVGGARDRRLEMDLLFCTMSYCIKDLSLFEPLLNPEEREGTAYFELHPKELPRPHACWLVGSFFVRDAAFDFFAECFHSASESFDYFSFQRFGEAEIDRLLQEVQSFLQDIAGAPSRKLLFSRYASIFTTDIWSEIETQDLAECVNDFETTYFRN